MRTKEWESATPWSREQGLHYLSHTAHPLPQDVSGVHGYQHRREGATHRARAMETPLYTQRHGNHKLQVIEIHQSTHQAREIRRAHTVKTHSQGDARKLRICQGTTHSIKEACALGQKHEDERYQGQGQTQAHKKSQGHALGNTWRFTTIHRAHTKQGVDSQVLTHTLNPLQTQRQGNMHKVRAGSIQSRRHGVMTPDQSGTQAYQHRALSHCTRRNQLAMSWCWARGRKMNFLLPHCQCKPQQASTASDGGKKANLSKEHCTQDCLIPVLPPHQYPGI